MLGQYLDQITSTSIQILSNTSNASHHAMRHIIDEDADREVRQKNSSLADQGRGVTRQHKAADAATKFQRAIIAGRI
jgi:hypothetical protein